jgi:hypothetical protein
MFAILYVMPKQLRYAMTAIILLCLFDTVLFFTDNVSYILTCRWSQYVDATPFEYWFQVPVSVFYALIDSSPFIAIQALASTGFIVWFYRARNWARWVFVVCSGLWMFGGIYVLWRTSGSVHPLWFDVYSAAFYANIVETTLISFAGAMLLTKPVHQWFTSRNVILVEG